MPQNPLEASFFGARLGNQSVFILDRRLSKLIVPIFLLFESWYLMHFLKKKIIIKIALKKEHEIKIETLMIMTFLKLKRKNAGLAKSSKKKAPTSIKGGSWL